MNLVALGWTAGLLEGEGSFIFTRTGSATISCEMTDFDVIEHLRKLWGGCVWERKPDRYHPTAMRAWKLAGNRAVQLMYSLYPLMGQRRRQRIADVIAQWRAKPVHGSPTMCKRGHFFDERNTYINTKGVRVCRQCRAESTARSKARRREVVT